MANVNAPNGFRPVGHAHGGTVNRRRRYHIAGGYANAIVTGDAVKLTNPAVNKDLQRPGATDMLIGVFDGCYYLDPNQSAPQYNRLWPAAQAVVSGSVPDAWVYDDPSDLFEAQMSLAFAVSAIGALANLVVGTENTTTKISADAVDSTTAAANSGVVFRIDDVVNRPDNAVGNFARVSVMISKHFLGATLTGV